MVTFFAAVKSFDANIAISGNFVLISKNSNEGAATRTVVTQRQTIYFRRGAAASCIDTQ